MEEITVLQSMLKILDGKSSMKKTIIELLPTLLNSFELNKESDIYKLIIQYSQVICKQLIYSQDDTLSESLKLLLVSFIDIVQTCNISDITLLLNNCIKLCSALNLKTCRDEQLENSLFCTENLYKLSKVQSDQCVQLNNLIDILIDILFESSLNKTRLESILKYLSNVMSPYCANVMWYKAKSVIGTNPERILTILYNLQCSLLQPSCATTLLKDKDYWDFICIFLTYENSIIRGYANTLLGASCIEFLDENYLYSANTNKNDFRQIWNDYVIVMETLENTQQHLVLPILNTAKKIALSYENSESDIYSYKLPLNWILALYNKMTKHTSKHVVLVSIDIITNMSNSLIKKEEQFLQLFVISLNNIFLYKMSNDVYLVTPKLEMKLTRWLNTLMSSDDGKCVFEYFLFYLPSVKWSLVPLVYITKSLSNIKDVSSCQNVVDQVLKMLVITEEMPNSYLKTTIYSFLFVFISKFFSFPNTYLLCDLFKYIVMYNKNTESWKLIVNSMKHIANLEKIDQQLSKNITEFKSISATTTGLVILSDIFGDNIKCMDYLNNTLSNVENISIYLLEFLENLLKKEYEHGGYDEYLKKILDENIWRLTLIWINQCFLNEDYMDNLIIFNYLNRTLSSNRIPHTLVTFELMIIWLNKCYLMFENKTGSFTILAIYSWIGLFAIKISENSLKSAWILATNNLFKNGYFSPFGKLFYHSSKLGSHIIPQLTIINTYFQLCSNVSELNMENLFNWIREKNLEKRDNFYNTYLKAAIHCLRNLSTETHNEQIILFVESCWEFLTSCRISCFPLSTKIFIIMAFDDHLLRDKKYSDFLCNQVMQPLLTKKYRDKFSVCFSLYLIDYILQNKIEINNYPNFTSSLSQFLAKCVIYNIERYGAIKIEWDTFEYIRSCSDLPTIKSISTKFLPDDRCLRFISIVCLFKINNVDLWKDVIERILQLESSFPNRKYFHNSEFSKIKQRVTQFLLITLCNEHFEFINILNNNVYQWLLSSLKEVSHIHSIAYQIIWLLVLIYNMNIDISKNLWNDFKNAYGNQNYLCSFISVVYHLHTVCKNEIFTNEAIKFLIPLCFSNGYKIRFYAQVTVNNLCSYCDGKYTILSESIEKVIFENEQAKKYDNPFKDFFYQNLDVLKSLSLKNICIELPRLCNVVYDERFPLEWIENFPIRTKFNEGYDLSTCSISLFIEKNTTSGMANEITIPGNTHHAQRKYIPVKSHDDKTKKSSLIVVASLIEKLTNLGGLARTCQVFGVSTLIVDNITCIEKREFTALSMTAEKHQNIVEVF
ncbi:probable methyltransferase TARBP1 isoform X2 [Daktulosphaira vitifoliae]|uniref:probable methyltransferase TARBP1 isoform X2 n=1 Tax=Daktulosphaira vitifoliae TaxID=58002 RepID=UPI0021A98D9F|nr:probable methyltransferase TARBP1 isoform X2 [Daktulosphaira vitifoliae]